MTTIRFKCPHCQKPLSVKEHLAGKKAACPACKKAITIPTAAAAPVDIEAVVAEAFADKPAEKPAEPVSSRTIDFTCPYCDEELKLAADLGGKKTPCPKCTNIIKVPVLEVAKPKDWRGTQKGGPSAARTNLPEQLADAWGTEQKGKVSREAMEEAGALAELMAAPVGVGVWIRRGFYACLAVGGLFLLVTMANRSREDKRAKDAVEGVIPLLPKLDGLQKAAAFRAIGEIYVHKRMVEKARESFNNARAILQYMSTDGTKEQDPPLEHDLLLIQLALAQAEMGGSEEEALGGRVLERFSWNDGAVQKDILQTLDAMRTSEAKAAALRDLTSLLMNKDKAEVAISLVSNLANVKDAKSGQGTPFLAQYVGLLLASTKDAAAAERLAAPDPSFIADTTARVAYTEGNARKRDYAEALKFAGAKGPPAGRLEACVAGAAIVLANAKNQDAAKEAKPFIDEGVKAYKDLPKEVRDKAPSWAVLELIRLGSRTDGAEGIKELVDSLPAEFRPRAQLDTLLGQLAKNPTRAGDAARVEDIGDAKHLTRALGWEALARHNSRLGDIATLSAATGDDNALLRPFILLGGALGEQDRRK